jgi:hypothetical protein
MLAGWWVGGGRRRAEALPQGVDALRAVRGPLGLAGAERGIDPERMLGGRRRAEALPQGVEALRAVRSPLGLAGAERGIDPERMLAELVGRRRV